MLRHMMLAATLAASLTGCGQVDLFADAPIQGSAMAQAQNPFMGLTRVKTHKGAPSDWYAKTTRQYLEATTSYGGKIWILDTVRGVEVLHNTQEMTNVRKRQQLLEGLKEARNEMEPREAAQVDTFIRLMIRSLPY